ncbi:MAG TPA: DUF58 domain-containing protein [Candidatus Nanopelagicales bacterium]
MPITGRTALLALLGTAIVGGLAAAGVAAWVALVAVNGVLLAAVVVDALLAASPRALVVRREGDRKVRLGETAAVTLTVTNTGQRPLRGWLRDAWAPTAGARVAGTASDRTELHLPAGRTAQIPMAITPSRRGDRPTDRITARSLGPLGLAGRQRSLRCPWSVRTLPAFASRRHLPSRLARLRDMDGRQAIAVRAQGTEFDSLREYVPGDDVRSIDWRATARAADVMVRTWRPERDRRVVIVLDTGRTSAGRIGDETRLDLLMDAALLLAALAGRAGDRVDLLAHDRRTRVQVSGGSGRALLPSLVDAMADLEPELAETDSRGLVAAVLRRVRKRALVVLLTTLDQAPMQEGLLPALPTLTARHTVVVAAVRTPPSSDRAVTVALGGARAGRDGDGGGAAGGDRSDAATAYRHAAQARADLDRAHVSAELARLGVRVVDAEPEHLAPALADAYLDLKAQGRL